MLRREIGRSDGKVGHPPTEGPAGDSAVPAAYTYFGQFVDHDVTLEAASAPLPDLLRPDLAPLARDIVPLTIRNLRTATLRAARPARRGQAEARDRHVAPPAAEAVPAPAWQGRR